MMWLTNEDTFTDESNKLLEPHMKEFWNMLETQGLKDMRPVEAIMSLATGEHISAKSMSLERKKADLEVADSNTKPGKSSKIHQPAVTDNSTGDTCVG